MNNVYRTARALLLAGATALALGDGNAQAQQVTVLGKVGNWEIGVDAGNCFMQSSYSSGTWLRLGPIGDGRVGYFHIGNPDWKSLRDGQKYEIGVSFDGGPTAIWHGEVVNLSGGVPVLFLPFANIDVYTLFERASAVRITWQGRTIWYGRLDGTRAASVAVANCLREMRANTAPRDPFAAIGPAKRVPAPAPKRDPFV